MSTLLVPTRRNMWWICPEAASLATREKTWSRRRERWAETWCCGCPVSCVSSRHGGSSVSKGSRTDKGEINAWDFTLSCLGVSEGLKPGKHWRTVERKCGLCVCTMWCYSGDLAQKLTVGNPLSCCFSMNYRLPTVRECLWLYLVCSISHNYFKN